MNQREKMLAALVGALLAVIGLWLSISTVNGWYTARHEEIDRLEREIKQKKKTKRIGTEASTRKASYEERSLPPDKDLARSQYQTWLRDSFERAGWKDIKLVANPARSEKDIFTMHTCTLSAQANLEQFTRWMHEFYSAKHMHRLRRCTLLPIKDSKQLTVQLTVEALSLPGSDNVEQLAMGESGRLKAPSVDDYLNDIVGRNLFAKANKPPSLSVGSRQQGYKGRPLRFSAKGTDPDKLDSVRFAIESAPVDARLDAKSGEFSWTPKENGDFELTIIAADDGLPSKSVRQKVAIKVTDPPPPEPVRVAPRKLDFDDAKHTYLTAIIRNGDEAVAWFTIRTTGETLKLREGQKIAVGSMDGVVAEIGQDDVIIETVDQKRLLLTRGTHLLQARDVGRSESLSRAPE